MSSSPVTSVTVYESFRTDVVAAYKAGQIDLPELLDALALCTSLLATNDAINVFVARTEAGHSAKEITDDMRGQVLAALAQVAGDDSDEMVH